MATKVTLAGMTILALVGAICSASEMCPVTPDEIAEPEFWVEYEGRRVHFCCRSCRQDFLQSPTDYVVNRADVSTPEPEASIPPSTKNASATARGRLVTFIGKWHPLFVHFPIALIITAFLVEIGGLCGRRERWRNAAQTCTAVILPLAGASAVLTTGTGWLAATSAHYPGDLTIILWRHRWFGIATMLVTITAATLQWYARSRAIASVRRLYLLVLLLGAALTAITGHLGATLIYGTNYLTF